MAAVYAGVPWAVAFEAESQWVTAMLIIKGEVEGGDFDLDAWEWRDRR